MFDLLADLVESLNQAFAVYIPMIQRIMINKRITHRRYEMMV